MRANKMEVVRYHGLDLPGNIWILLINLDNLRSLAYIYILTECPCTFYYSVYIELEAPAHLVSLQNLVDLASELCKAAWIAMFSVEVVLVPTQDHPAQTQVRTFIKNLMLDTYFSSSLIFF